MRGQPNHGLVAAAITVEPATVRGRLFGLPEGYPAMIEGDGIVHGQLCLFDDLGPFLPDLDAYEGSLYRRIRCEVTTERGERRVAWCFVTSEIPPGAWPIPSGRW